MGRVVSQSSDLGRSGSGRTMARLSDPDRFVRWHISPRSRGRRNDFGGASRPRRGCGSGSVRRRRKTSSRSSTSGRTRSPFRFPTLSLHDLPCGAGDGPDDRSQTGQQEGDEDDGARVGVSSESKPDSRSQPGSEQGRSDDSCNNRHVHTAPVRGWSVGIGSLALHCKVRL